MKAESRLGIAERIAAIGVFAGLAGTIAAVAFEHAYPDASVWVWRTIFWPSFVLMLAAIVFLACDLGPLFIRRRRTGAVQPTQARARAIAAILLLVGGLFGSGWYVSTLPTPMRNREPPSTSVPTPELQSRGTRFIFACPRPPKNDRRSREEVLAEIQRNAAVVGDTFGLLITISDIPEGVRMEVAPKTADRALEMNGITKIVIEMRGLGKRVMVTASMELITPLDLLFSLMPVDPNSQQTAQMKKLIEQMAEAPPGKCQLL